MKKRAKTELLMPVVLSMMVGVLPAVAQNNAKKFPISRGPVQQINEHFNTQAIRYDDGVTLERDMINGPRVPPKGYEHERASVSRPEPNLTQAENSLSVPAYNWVFGCSAVSGAMIAGYYDRNGFDKIYTGPTNGGVTPLVEDVGWGDWVDINGREYPNNPLIASHEGLDGREMGEYGSIDDYWVFYLSGEDDPYIIDNRIQHEWGDAIGDYMKTSQSFWGNDDGWTYFYVDTSGSPLTCDDMEDYFEPPDGEPPPDAFPISDSDGTYGRKLFYEARGYEVTDCYAQLTENEISGGFSFDQFKAEIDAGRPVHLNLVGHSIVGVGYHDRSKKIYIHDTWDNEDHVMRWGDSYAGMNLYMVSIVNIQQQVTGPNISVFPPSHDFGSIPVDSTSSQNFTVFNTGSEVLTIDGISLSGDLDFTLGVDDCPSELESSLNCSVEVIFDPSSTGSKSADLIISSDDPDEPMVSVALTGLVYSIEGELDLSGFWGNLTKERKGKSAYKVYGTFTIQNTGNVDLSSVEVKYYFSSDPDNIPDQPFLSEYLSINANSAIESDIAYNAGKIDPAGGYLVAHIDPSSQIDETDETNNRIPSLQVP